MDIILRDIHPLEVIGVDSKSVLAGDDARESNIGIFGPIPSKRLRNTSEVEKFFGIERKPSP